VERNPKRARKKEARDKRTAALIAEYRRRRAARIAAVAVAVVAIVSLMLYATREDEPDTPAAGDETEETTDPADGDDGENDTGASAEEAPCPKVKAPKSNPKTDYASAPDPAEVLEEGIDYLAVIRTSCGNIRIDLDDERPATIANFVFLAREGYYDGLTWHRVEQNFVIQAGDPDNVNGQPPDGPGYEIPDEVEGTTADDYVYGALGMANAGPDTGGSQFFFIVHDPDAAIAGEGPEPAGLEPQYTVFGHALQNSYEVLNDIANQPTDPTTSQPVVPVYIEGIDIVEK
jgi:cyclophilin family peptidyl-prolyl cis-trans isomerase